MVNKYHRNLNYGTIHLPIWEEHLQQKYNSWQHDYDTFTQKSILFHQIKQFYLRLYTKHIYS